MTVRYIDTERLTLEEQARIEHSIKVIDEVKEHFAKKLDQSKKLSRMDRFWIKLS